MGFTYKKLRLNHREHMHMGNTQANASAHTRIHTYLHAPAQFWKLILHTHTRPAPAPGSSGPAPGISETLPGRPPGSRQGERPNRPGRLL